MMLMNYMKIFNGFFQLFVLFILLTLVDGQVIIPYEKTPSDKMQINEFEQPILKPDRFSMTHGFNLSTSMNNKMSQTTGIFSNFIHYKLSEKMHVKTALHLIQNQNNLSFSSKPSMGYGYELDIEYKLSPNSFISLQILNHVNSTHSFPLQSIFNAP